MKAEIKSFEFKIEDAQSNGTIRGYASTFGNIDLGDDVIDAGAFKKTLRENGGKIPILADHDPTKLLGWNVRAEETDKGLLIEGKLNLDVQVARERYSLAKQALEVGAPMGLSIGYGVIKAEPDKERPRVRRLKELKLYEYSMVTFPMNTSALVTAAKAFEGLTDVRELSLAIANQAKTLGLNLSEIINALQLSGAAENSLSIDPLDIEQSEKRMLEKSDRILQLLKL